MSLSDRTQEVHRWTDPSYSLKLAMFTYGLMCDVLPRNTWLAAGYPGGGLRRRSTFSALAQATTATGEGGAAYSLAPVFEDRVGEWWPQVRAYIQDTHLTLQVQYAPRQQLPSSPSPPLTSHRSTYTRKPPTTHTTTRSASRSSRWTACSWPSRARRRGRCRTPRRARPWCRRWRGWTWGSRGCATRWSAPSPTRTTRRRWVHRRPRHPPMHLFTRIAR